MDSGTEFHVITTNEHSASVVNNRRKSCRPQINLLQAMPMIEICEYTTSSPRLHSVLGYAQ